MTKESVRMSQKNVASLINASRYRQGMIPTENLKLEQFLDIIFGSKMSLQEMKTEAVQYMKILETGYIDRISNLQNQLEKVKKHAQSDRIKNVSKVVERGDLEYLFVQCVEEVRKDIVRRRLKNEFAARRKHNFSQSQEAEIEFENSLLKLADMAKGRVKYEEFTAHDRLNLLDLFVNNERTLLTIHECLFPGQNSAKNLNSLRNPSDRITFNTDRKQENLTNLDNSISSISAELDPLKLNNKSVIHYTARNNKNAAFASLTTPSLEVTKKSNLILETDLANSQHMRFPNF